MTSDAADLLPDLVALRRGLHADPEIGLDLPRTQRRVLDALAGLPLDITLGTGCTSVTAVLHGVRPGPAVLLRGDMDALPVAEDTGLDFAATSGVMHACGHDLHTAGLVGAAHLLAAHRDELAGSVVFMFQPGEEGYDGARVMIDEGVLAAAGTPLVGAYAIHVLPGPRGVFVTRPGAVLAGANLLRINVNGVGGHGSMPQAAVDPVPPVAEIVTALQSMVTRRFGPEDPVVLTITQLAGGDAISVIPSTASLAGTARTLSTAATERIQQEVRRLAEGIATAHGCTADVVFDIAYPVTLNDAAETARSVDALRTVFGEERVRELPQPLMGSEDFSRVLQAVPGTLFGLMATPAGVDPASAWNHSPQVQFDDGVLADESVALATLAVSKLAGSD